MSPSPPQAPSAPIAPRALLTLLVAAFVAALLLWTARTAGVELGGMCYYGKVRPTGVPYACLAFCWMLGAPPALLATSLMLYATNRARARRIPSNRPVTLWAHFRPALRLTVLLVGGVYAFSWLAK